MVYEELSASWGKLSFGVHSESVQVESFGNPVVARFVSASRSFNLGTFAPGAMGNLPPGIEATRVAVRAAGAAIAATGFAFLSGLG